MENVHCYYSVIGFLKLVGNENAITGLYFSDEAFDNIGELTDEMRKCISQLDEYFRGERKEFDLNLDMSGTEFRKKCWKELTKIPYGEVVTYGHIANAISSPKAVRAVGGANHNNPISIIVPCHRVIGANGTLTGYGGGLHRKEALLKLEKDNL